MSTGDVVPSMETASMTRRSRPSPTSLTNLPDILSALSELESEEAETSNKLSQLLSSQESIQRSLARLRNLAPQLDELHLDASHLSDKVSSTAKTADRVGSRVRRLDEEMMRVREASERVGQVMELKASLASLQSSIQSQDWESASRHCARAMAIPTEVISGRFAERTVPTSELPLPPAQALQSAREELLSTFLRQFKAASQARDGTATSRFFKLFPAIGWEKEGLNAYATFVSELVQTKMPPSAKTSSSLYYITALTALFESICSIIDQHQSIVEKYYGSGKMLHVVEKLMEDCDRTVRKTIQSWEEERAIKRQINETAVHVFQSSVIRKQASQGTEAENETVDAREIDKVVSEAAAMIMRYSAFRRYLYNNLLEDAQGHDNSASATQGFSAPTLALIESSMTRQLFLDMLTSDYLPLEIWYLRCTIDQAHRITSPDSTQTPPTTSTPDLVFYLLKNVLYRVLGTGSVDAVSESFGKIRDVMDNDYANVMKYKLDGVYRNASARGTSTNLKSERENRLAFVVLLNDLDVSSSHMERLIKDILGSQTIEQSFLPHEDEIVRSSISSLLSLVPGLKSTLKSGIEQLFSQLIRPRLRTLLTDVYKDVSYVLDDEAYTAAEYRDVVRKRFVKAWETLIEGYKESFTDANFSLFFSLVLDVLVRPWEKFILTFKYNDLGAVRFDHDVRAIAGYLSSQTAFGDTRERFQRLHQISTILNLDRDEDVDEFYSSSGITWKLTSAEAHSVAALKI